MSLPILTGICGLFAGVVIGIAIAALSQFAGDVDGDDQ